MAAEKAAAAIASEAGGIAQAISSVFVEQQKTQAKIIEAQQKVQAEGVKANEGILHELDRPFVRYKTSYGRKDKEGKAKHSLEIDLSILDCYAMGDMAERFIGDMAMIEEGNVPDNFAAGWILARAPLRSRSPSLSASERPGTSAEAAIDKAKASATQTYIDEHPEFFK